MLRLIVGVVLVLVGAVWVGQGIGVIGGNVEDSVTLNSVPVTADGRLAGGGLKYSRFHTTALPPVATRNSVTLAI